MKSSASSLREEEARARSISSSGAATLHGKQRGRSELHWRQPPRHLPSSRPLSSASTKHVHRRNSIVVVVAVVAIVVVVAIVNRHRRRRRMSDLHRRLVFSRHNGRSRSTFSGGSLRITSLARRHLQHLRTPAVSNRLAGAGELRDGQTSSRRRSRGLRLERALNSSSTIAPAEGQRQIALS